MSDLEKIVEEVAPVVENLVVGNVPGAIASVVSTFSGDSKESAAIETGKWQHQEAMVKAEVEDRASARQMGERVELFREMLVAALVLVLVVDLVAIGFVKDSAVKHFLVMMSGVLIAELRNVLKLYFGSDGT
jgi:Flp pilus assembly protein TadB